MPSLYELKPRFQTLLHPLAGKLAALGVTANQVTIAAVAASAAYGAAMLLTGGSSLLLSLLPVFLFMRMALNALDGVMARDRALPNQKAPRQPCPHSALSPSTVAASSSACTGVSSRLAILASHSLLHLLCVISRN